MSVYNVHATRENVTARLASFPRNPYPCLSPPRRIPFPPVACDHGRRKTHRVRHVGIQRRLRIQAVAFCSMHSRNNQEGAGPHVYASQLQDHVPQWTLQRLTIPSSWLPRKCTESRRSTDHQVCLDIRLCAPPVLP